MGLREQLRLLALECLSSREMKGKTNLDFGLNTCRECTWVCASPTKTGGNASSLNCMDALAT